MPRRYFLSGNINIPMDTPFGKWLVGRLAEAGITQAELARRIGVQQPHVSRLISGGRGTTVEILVDIARALGEAPETVFRVAIGLPASKHVDATIERMISMISDLPVEEQDFFLHTIELRHRQMVQERGKRGNKEKNKGRT